MATAGEALAKTGADAKGGEGADNKSSVADIVSDNQGGEGGADNPGEDGGASDESDDSQKSKPGGKDVDSSDDAGDDKSQEGEDDDKKSDKDLSDDADDDKDKEEEGSKQDDDDSDDDDDGGKKEDDDDSPNDDEEEEKEDEDEPDKDDEGKTDEEIELENEVKRVLKNPESVVQALRELQSEKRKDKREIRDLTSELEAATEHLKTAQKKNFDSKYDDSMFPVLDNKRGFRVSQNKHYDDPENELNKEKYISSLKEELDYLTEGEEKVEKKTKKVDSAGDDPASEEEEKKISNYRVKKKRFRLD